MVATPLSSVGIDERPSRMNQSTLKTIHDVYPEQNSTYEEPRSGLDDVMSKKSKLQEATPEAADGDSISNSLDLAKFGPISVEARRLRPPVALRRSTTVAVPQFLRTSALFNGQNANDADTVDLKMPVLTRSKSCPVEQAAAEAAIENGSTQFQFSTATSARGNVRQMYSYKFTAFPRESIQSVNADVKIGPVWRKMQVKLNRERLICSRTSIFRRKIKDIRVSCDDILGAIRTEHTNEVVLHLMKRGKGEDQEKLKRRYRQIELRFNSAEIAETFVRGVQLLVKWDARVPLEQTRKIKVVVNPHSGKRHGLQIWQKWQPVFELAGIQCDMETTKYGGHARDIGHTLDLSANYEAIVFVGGDGTVMEFMNGVFARGEDEWRNLVATTPLSLMCAGTDNAFGVGVGIPTHEAAVYCIIKRKIRPLDVMVCETDGDDGTPRREFACTGINYGIGGDIAMESEQTRWLGVHRYKWLKMKRGVFAPKPHECTIKYILSDTVPTDPETGNQILKTYFEIKEDNAHDQHRVERCSIYDDTYQEKRWEGDARSIFEPASEDRYKDQWREESCDYNSVGVSNVYFETPYYHPSDGNMDMIVARRGPLGQSVDAGLRYLTGTYLKSPLVDYFKIKALKIELKRNDPINVDGEVLPGINSFRIEVVPQLLNVLSEK